MQGLYTVVREFKKNRQPNRALVTHCLGTSCLVAATAIFWHLAPTMSYVVSPVLLAVVFFRSFAIMHDAVHGTVHSNKTLNHAVGVLYGAICWLPYWPWRKLHIEHHQWSGNVEKDPVMKLLTAYPKFSKSYRGWLNFSWRNWLPYMAFLQHTVFWSESWKRVLQSDSSTDKKFNLASVLTAVAIYGSLATWAPVGAMLQLVAGVVLYMVMVEVINFPHHLDLPQYDGDAKFSFTEQFQFARSCHYPKAFSHLVLNNFNYHTEHHMFPQVPWYELGKLRPQVKAALGAQYNECHGSEWIVVNKDRDLSEVFCYSQASKLSEDVA